MLLLPTDLLNWFTKVPPSVVERTDWVSLPRTDSGLRTFGTSFFFFKKTPNSIFYSLEKGTSTSIVPRKPKNMLMMVIEKKRGMTVSVAK